MILLRHYTICHSVLIRKQGKLVWEKLPSHGYKINCKTCQGGVTRGAWIAWKYVSSWICGVPNSVRLNNGFSVLEGKFSIQNDLNKMKKRSEEPGSTPIATQTIALKQD